MANSPYLTDQAVLGASPEVVGLERQRKLADLLTSQAFQSPQGQMISGHYVKPATTQQIQPLLSALLGSTLNQSLDEKQTQLAAALRGKQAQDIQTYSELQKSDPSAALRFAISSDNPTLKTLAQDELKGMKLGEGETFTRPSLSGGVTELKGGAKYHAPISIDTGNSTILLDPITRQKIAEYPKAHQPVAGQVVETANGPMLIDTRTGASKPIMANGQPLAPKLSSEQSKDITSINQQRSTIEGALKSVETNPTAFSFSRGAAQNLPYGESLAGRMDKPENAAARAYVFNNVSAVIKERAGTAQSASEMQRINSFMPAVTDNSKQIENKLNGFKTYLKDLESGTRINPNVPMQPQGSVQVSPASQGPRVVDFNSLPTGAR
jgi:hypothetical protein